MRKPWRILIVTWSDCYSRQKSLLSQRWPCMSKSGGRDPSAGLLQRSWLEMTVPPIRGIPVKRLGPRCSLTAEPVELTGRLDARSEKQRVKGQRYTHIYKAHLTATTEGGRTWCSTGDKEENRKQMIASKGRNFKRENTAKHCRQRNGPSFLSDPVSLCGTHFHFPRKWGHLSGLWETDLIKWKQVSGKME